MTLELAPFSLEMNLRELQPNQFTPPHSAKFVLKVIAIGENQWKRSNAKNLSRAAFPKCSMSTFSAVPTEASMSVWHRILMLA